MTTDTLLTGEQALSLLQEVGYTIDRITDKVYVRRGASKLTLPKTDELCNSNLNRIVHGVVADLRSRESNGGQSAFVQPLMVVYRSVVYGVAEDRGIRWQLMDLDDGHLFEVLKSACQEYVPEPEPVKDDLWAEVAANPSPKPPEPVYTPMTNLSDRAAMYRQVRRYIEGMKVEYEQLEAKARVIRDRAQPALLFLESLGDDVTELQFAPLQPAIFKRTVLPPSDAKGRRSVKPSGKLTDRTELRNHLREAFIRSGRNKDRGYLQKLFDEIERLHGYKVDVHPSYAYKMISDFEKET